MRKITISPRQLFTLMVLFELGSAAVVGIGLDAKQDAWIVIILACIGGVIMFNVYGYLNRAHSGLILTTYIRTLCGKYIGTAIAMIYVLYFIFVSTLVIRDVSDLLIRTSFDQTPYTVLCLLMMILVCYSVLKGFEVLARVSEFFFFISITTISVLFVFTLFSDVIDLNNLRPILEGGWTPVFKTAFPGTYSFPFGEAVVFTMFLPLVNPENKAIYFASFALLVSGFIFSFSSVVTISTLGASRALYEAFPTLSAMSEINVGNFIQRLDSFGLSLLVIGGFFKIAVFQVAAIHGLQDIFHIKEHRINVRLIIILSILTTFTASYMAGNQVEYLYLGWKIVPKYVHFPMQVILPSIFVLLTLIQQRSKQC